MPNQIQLCKGVCFDSYTQKCTEEIVVPCTVDPVTHICLAQSNLTTATHFASISTSIPNLPSTTVTYLTVSSSMTSSTTTTESTTISTTTTDSTTSTSTTTTESISTSTASTTTISSTTSTMTWPLTTTFPISNSCCVIQQCTTDSDCCVPGAECQCYRRNQNYGYGSCLNPNIKPICAEGCPAQDVCLSDTDCCKCQCVSITVTNVDGTSTTRKQCVPR